MFLRSGAKALTVIAASFGLSTTSLKLLRHKNTTSSVIFTPSFPSQAVPQITVASSPTPTLDAPSVCDAPVVCWCPHPRPTLQTTSVSFQTPAAAPPLTTLEILLLPLADIKGARTLLAFSDWLSKTSPNARHVFVALGLVLWSLILPTTSFLVQVCHSQRTLQGTLLTSVFRTYLFFDC